MADLYEVEGDIVEAYHTDNQELPEYLDTDNKPEPDENLDTNKSKLGADISIGNR